MRKLCKGHDWRLLLNLIDHLPAGHYRAAVAADEEAAAAVLDRFGDDDLPQGDRQRSMAEWDAHVELLTEIANGLKELTRVTLAVNGNKPPKIPFAPYPETALQRLRGQRKRAYQQDLRASLVFAPEPPT